MIRRVRVILPTEEKWKKWEVKFEALPEQKAVCTTCVYNFSQRPHKALI